jgi:nucleoid DNA-binding protein
MDINAIIQDLLIKNNSVAVAGLGTFSLRYMPAEIQKFPNQVTPPSHKLIFTENFDISDHSVINVLSKENNFSFTEAKALLDNWVKEVFITIDRESNYTIKELGILKKENNKIIFEAFKDSSVFADNFGLEIISMPLIEIEGEIVKEAKPYQPVYIPQRVKKNSWVNGILIAFIVLLLGFSIFLLLHLGYLQSGIGKIVALFKAKSEATITQLATNDTLNGKIDANALKRNALLYKENKGNGDVNASQQSEQKAIRYYLIAGSFKKIKSAEILKNELTSKGFAPEILSINDSIYRVSLVSFTNRNKAVEEYIMLTTGEFNNKLWLYSQIINE